ncbi:MAG: M20 family metallo-hydrolase [Oscillospiraceae bacterium]
MIYVTDMNAKLTQRIEKHLVKIAQFNSTPGEGITRFPFTESAKECVDYLMQAMKNAGLETRMDGSGAVVGRLRGLSDKTIAVGSHYDSVQHGGCFDGIAGVVCGIVLAEYLREQGITPACSLEIIAMNDEEGARFKGGFFSSKAMLGQLSAEDLDNTLDADGISVAQAMSNWGLTPDDLMASKRDMTQFKAFLEVHIEQGPILEAAAKEIGVVKTIVGMERFLCEVTGRADHAGTTPMDMRKDALLAAAKIISAVNEAALSESDSVATVGYISVLPNEINTIAQKAVFTLDIRSVSEEKVQRITQNCLDKISSVCAEQDMDFSVTNTLSVKPTDMDAQIMGLITQSCKERGYSFMELNSGAGHDSLPIGKVIPTAMIFVPTKGGRSHCPEEWCEYSDLAKAVVILSDVINNMK